MPIRSAKFTANGHIYSCPDSGLVVPSVTRIRDHFGFGFDYSVVNKETMEFARSMGQAVDDAISIVEGGEEVGEIDPRVQQCLEQFLELKEKAKWKTTAVHNGTIGPAVGEYGGMPCGFCTDLIGTLDGEEAVAEVKRVATVGSGAGFQTAGYDVLLEGKYRRRIVFQLWPHKYRLWTDRDPNSKIFDRCDYAMFQSALAMTWFQINKCILKVEDMNGNAAH